MILRDYQTGAGKTIVLLHGLFGRAQNLGAVARHLAALYRVVSLDLRNHGASAHAVDMDYTTLAADVMETLAALNALPAVLLGHSMGGKVAMAAALGAPRHVSGLIVADIAPVAYHHANQHIAAALLNLPLTADLTRGAADAALKAAIPDAALRQFLLQNLVPGEKPVWRIGLNHIAQGIPNIEGFPDFPAGAVYAGPSLFVRGAQSAYVQPDHIAVIRVRFPVARIATLENAGHWLHADQPAAFLAAIEDFLGQRA